MKKATHLYSPPEFILSRVYSNYLCPLHSGRERERERERDRERETERDPGDRWRTLDPGPALDTGHLMRRQLSRRLAASDR